MFEPHRLLPGGILTAAVVAVAISPPAALAVPSGKATLPRQAPAVAAHAEHPAPPPGATGSGAGLLVVLGVGGLVTLGATGAGVGAHVRATRGVRTAGATR